MLSLAKECYSMKLDLLTNATVVEDAIRFVLSNKSKEKLKSSSGNINSSEDDKQASESDYYEGKDQLEEKQEEEAREIISATTNQVFNKT
jgi:hypothetical protein